MSLRVRCQLTLKDLKGQSGLTLFANLHQIYSFLIDVMRAGYQECGKDITVDDAHTALRTVWGRSKQLRKEEKNKVCHRESREHRKTRTRTTKKKKRHWSIQLDGLFVLRKVPIKSSISVIVSFYLYVHRWKVLHCSAECSPCQCTCTYTCNVW